MSGRIYIGLDQGTTGVTALAFDEQWQAVGRGYREIGQHYPQLGWVEHDAEEILASAQYAVKAALAAAGAQPGQVRALGLDHEGESVVVWERSSGRPVYPAIVWQDRRTAAMAEELEEKHGALFRERTGLTPDAYFSATKLKWILDRVDPDRSRAKSGQLLAGNMDAWLMWNMTGGVEHRTDASTASRTMLYNIRTGTWDRDLLELLDIPERLLPEIGDSAGRWSTIRPEGFAGLSCPVCAAMADQQAAMVGQICLEPGSVKTTYGTGCFMLMNTGDEPIYSRSGLVTTVGWQLKGQRTCALDGGIYIAGAAIQWLRDGLKVIRSAAQTEELALSVADNGGVYFVPAFTGLAAPHWDSYARGMMIGITGGTTDAHVARAALEATAYQVKDVLDAMERDSGVAITAMRCDGGSAVNRFLMQFQADLLGLPVDVPKVRDTTAQGAAYMAAVGVDDYASLKDFEGFWQLERRYEPRMGQDQRQLLMERWHRAVDRCRGWEK